MTREQGHLKRRFTRQKKAAQATTLSKMDGCRLDWKHEENTRRNCDPANPPVTKWHQERSREQIDQYRSIVKSMVRRQQQDDIDGGKPQHVRFPIPLYRDPPRPNQQYPDAYRDQVGNAPAPRDRS